MIASRDPRARRPTEGRRFFLRADGDRLPGPQVWAVPSFARSEGFFMSSAIGRPATTRADAGPCRAPRVRIVLGFRAGPAGGGRCRRRGAAGGTSAHFPPAEVVGALARRLSGDVDAAALARHGRRRACGCRACWSASSRAARWRWRARRCRGCFATRWRSRACSASRRGRRWARCWRSTSISRGARSGCCPRARSWARPSTRCWCSRSRRAWGGGACSRRRCCWSASRSCR